MKYKKHYLFLALVSYAFLLVSYQSEAQSGPTPEQYILNGTVTDSYGPMPGVHVLIKGTNTGTFTDKDGEFSLTVIASNTLVFTYLGYRALELSILGRTTLEVELQPEATQLQEVEVNAGYYTVKERERTGSISRVTAEEIELQPVINPIQALQGRMAGVEIVQRNGVPGTAANIQIRGQNSLRNSLNDNGNLPLFIIDGIPVNSSPIRTLGGDLQGAQGIDPLNTLNLSNIEGIEILKDADATAIYGSRGANGVVLITTKSGKKNMGKTILDVELYSGLGHVSNKMKLLNTKEYLQMRKEAFDNDEEVPTTINAPDLLLWNQNRNSDWQKELIGGTAYINNIQTSFSGGNDHTSFRFGGAIHREGTVFPGDFDYQKINGFLNLNHSSTNKRFMASVMVNYGEDKHRLFQDSFVPNVLRLAPNAPALYATNGELNWENSTWNNPLAALDRPQIISTKNHIVNSTLSYEVIKNLDVKVNLGYTRQDTEEERKNPVSSYDPAVRSRLINRSSHNSTKRDSWIIEPQILYSSQISKMQLDFIIGSTFQKTNNDVLGISGQGYSDERFIGSLAAATEIGVIYQSEAEYAYSAVFGRAGVNWAKKYFINLTGRRDGSSRFGPGKKFENFGAIGAAWIFSEERIIKNNMSFINFGKLRGSYGTTGSDQIPDYGYHDVYQINPEGGLYPYRLFNPDFSWELNKKLELAMDVGIFKDRIRMEASWYHNRSSNQLVGYPISTVSGFASVQANLPATVQNEGWELVMSTNIIRAKKINWQASLNMTFPKNKLIEFPNIEQTSYANLYSIGEPLNIRKLYKYKGINMVTGLYEVEDINGDGKYDYEDRIIIRDVGRQYYGGINNSLAVKNFQLDFLVEFVQQYGVSNMFLNNSFPPGFGPQFNAGNVSATVLAPWDGPGSESTIQRYTQSVLNLSTYNLAYSSNAAYSNESSFIRLKTLSLSYQIPTSYFERSGLTACKLFVHGQNLFTWTKYKGLDPQFAGGGVLPPLRIVTMGIQLKF